MHVIRFSNRRVAILVCERRRRRQRAIFLTAHVHVFDGVRPIRVLHHLVTVHARHPIGQGHRQGDGAGRVVFIADDHHRSA